MALKGAKAHVARLKKLSGPRADFLIGRALFAAGQKIQVEAQLSITRGAVSGKNHVPSAPGQPPNQDTGSLSGNIETTLEMAPSGPVVTIASNAPYSAPLEFGTSKMAARPFMRPARDKMRPAGEELVEKAVKRLARESRSRS